MRRAGLSYNLWLKGTHWSALPYVAGFALLPAFVWIALDSYRNDLLALYAVALPLTVAAHVANTLPDIETDQASGRRSLTVTLGRSRSLVLFMSPSIGPGAMGGAFEPWPWLRCCSSPDGCWLCRESTADMKRISG
jgi:4-hydroxybenzoate polyprenyltransferase